MEGSVTFYNEERGYGFVLGDDEKSYFFHVTSYEPNVNELDVGDRVDFEGGQVNGKPKVSKIKRKYVPKENDSKNLKRRRKTEFTPDYDGPSIDLEGSALISCLEEISLWKLEAKLEDPGKYFFNVPEVDQIKTGRKSYVIGRKGSGKSAIVSYLTNVKSNGFCSEKLSFKNFPFNELYRLENDRYTKPNQYITLWKYIIYSTVVRKMASRGNVDPLVKRKIEKVYPEPDASDLKGLLRKWTGGDFSLNILGNGFSFANWFSRKVETDWFERVDHLEHFIKKNCDDSVYLVLFDELDEDYKEMMDKGIDGGYIHLLTSLFKAVQDVRSIMDRCGKNIYPVVFLRDDIFDLLTDSDKNKWRDLTTNLEWSLPDIKDLLKYRIEKSGGFVSDSFLKTWHAVFDDKSIPYSRGRKSLHSLDYIARSTHGRPRDYIHYLQVCASSQRNSGRIEKNTVISADKTYSNYLKSELVDEIHGVIPDISNVFRVLSQIRKWILGIDEFIDVFDEYTEKGLIQTKDAGFVLQTLFYFSVIGNVSRNHQVHIFRHEHPEAVLNFNEKVVIHRGLMKALQII